MKRNIKRILKLLLVALFIYTVIFIWMILPIVTGYGAKTLCSGIFVCGHNPTNIIKAELGSFPSNMGSYSVDMKGSSVTASIFGLAKRKAVFRKGLGATLVVGMSEQELREEAITINLSQYIHQDTLCWPQENQLIDITSKSIDKQQLGSALTEAFKDSNTQRPNGTRAIVVVYDGQMINERYAKGYSASTVQSGFSMAKSIMNALIGILVKQGKLDINSPAPVSQWKNDKRKLITIANLMQMNSGLRWSEFPFGPSGFTNMLFKEKDMAEFAISAPSEYNPGIIFNYSSGSSAILSHIIHHTLGDSNYYRFPYEQLFFKIGMFSAIMEVDPAGTFVGSNYTFATARDWARFGLLYLNDGIWNGERILPEGWINFTTKPSGAKTNSSRGAYGASWWLNSTHTYPNVPADCFSCQGYGGQYVWVIPSKKLVVVRLAFDQESAFSPDIFLSGIIKALPE